MEFSRTGTNDFLRERLLLVPLRRLDSVNPILSTCDGSSVFIFISASYFFRKDYVYITKDIYC
jgi:hypothetical protein